MDFENTSTQYYIKKNSDNSKSWDFQEDIQKQALFNEMRGNLFEFLFARKLASKLFSDFEFEKSQSPELVRQLQVYQNHLLSVKSAELKGISALADAAVQAWVKGYSSKSMAKLKHEYSKIFVVGKIHNQQIKQEFGEADIVLIGQNKLQNKIKQTVLPISLKMVNSSAFINTKSAGSKSFFKNYFFRFKQIECIQDEFNDFVQERFLQLMRNVREHYDLDLKDFDFSDANSLSTLSKLRENLPSNLPGKQSKKLKVKIHELYNSIAIKIYHKMVEFSVQSKEEFIESLFTLFGISNPSVTCFYCLYSKYDQNISPHSFLQYDYKDLKREFKHLKIQDNPPVKSSFLIETTNYYLQIRVKPMNEFTVPSYKINCSIQRK